MSARKRKEDESFKEYRKNLKSEATKERWQQRGKLIHNSDGGHTYIINGK